jgi:hypothetical protein
VVGVVVRGLSVKCGNGRRAEQLFGFDRLNACPTTPSRCFIGLGNLTEIGRVIDEL